MIISNTNQVIDSANITFQVDMSEVSDPFTAPELNGTFNSWCGNCNSMSDFDGDNVWEVTVKLQSGDTVEYKYSADSWSIQETNDPSGPCTNGDPNFTNRLLVVPNTDLVLDKVCWGSCDSCTHLTSLINNFFDDLTIFPNPSSNFISFRPFKDIDDVYIYDVSGKLVHFKSNLKSNSFLDISFLKKGSYYLILKSKDSLIKQKFLVNK